MVLCKWIEVMNVHISVVLGWIRCWVIQLVNDCLHWLRSRAFWPEMTIENNMSKSSWMIQPVSSSVLPCSNMPSFPVPTCCYSSYQHSLITSSNIISFSVPTWSCPHFPLQHVPIPHSNMPSFPVPTYPHSPFQRALIPCSTVPSSPVSLFHHFPFQPILILPPSHTH